MTATDNIVEINPRITTNGNAFRTIMPTPIISGMGGMSSSSMGALFGGSSPSNQGYIEPGFWHKCEKQFKSQSVNRNVLS